MARPFAFKKGRLVARLSRQERQVLDYVCEDLEELLSDDDAGDEVPGWARDLGLAGMGEARSRPADPALARLLPDAYADPAQADEFRRLTEAGLRARKLGHIAVVREGLAEDPIVITDVAQSWLSFLADARLALGTRLEITDDDAMEPGDDPQYNLYLYLGYLQQSLVEELMG